MTTQEFIAWAEAYFTDIKWDKTVKRKLEMMVRSLDTRTIEVEKPIVVIKNVIRYVSPNSAPVEVRPELDDLAIMICNKHNITITELRGKCQKSKFVSARVDFVRMSRATYHFTISELAHYLNRDHTTAIHYLRHWKPHTIFSNTTEIGNFEHGSDGSSDAGDQRIKGTSGKQPSRIESYAS